LSLDYGWYIYLYSYFGGIINTGHLFWLEENTGWSQYCFEAVERAWMKDPQGRVDE